MQKPNMEEEKSGFPEKPQMWGEFSGNRDTSFSKKKECLMSRKNNANRSTPFDDTFKTMQVRTPFFQISLINEIFGRSYETDSEDFIQLLSEHPTKRGKRIEDSRFQISGEKFHLECQSTPDCAIPLRQIEYDFADALEEAYTRKSKKHTYDLVFANSCILQLRGARTKLRYETVRMKGPDKKVLKIKIPIVYVQAYSLDEILAKKLFLFIPFYMMRYEKQFRDQRCPKDTEMLLFAIQQDFQKLEEGIYHYFSNSDHFYCYGLLNDLIRQILDAILPAGDSYLRNEVYTIMGGHELVTPTTIFLDRGFRKGVRSERANTANERKLRKEAQQTANQERKLRKEAQQSANQERKLRKEAQYSANQAIKEAQQSADQERNRANQAAKENHYLKAELEKWKNLALSFQNNAAKI